MPTRAPAPASASATARPMPTPAPLTRAARPARLAPDASILFSPLVFSQATTDGSCMILSVHPSALPQRYPEVQEFYHARRSIPEQPVSPRLLAAHSGRADRGGGAARLVRAG